MRTDLSAIILAGGAGTRLWPLSRNLSPKHLLNLTDKESLLQQTARRLLATIPPERIFTITHEDHRFEVKDQVQKVSPHLADNILAEPQANNTLPAIAWAVAEIVCKGRDTVIFVSPSDHLIRNEAVFQTTIQQAWEAADKNYLVTLGIPPTSPETGYGYIKAGPQLTDSVACRVEAFVEKPDRETALRYLQDGHYYWNSGIFVFRSSLFLRELERAQPEIFRSVNRIAATPPQEKESILRQEYVAMKSISIDYGILEKSDRVAVVPAEFGWSDLGSWQALYDQMPKDKDQNVIEGDVLSLDSHSSLLISKKGLLATIGLDGVAVVQTDDAVLVSPLERVQAVKKIVESLKEKGSTIVESHSTVTRPWGHYTVLEEGPHYKIKRIVVNPSQKLSLQRHQHRAEHWVVIEGTAKVTNGLKEIVLKENESAFISRGEKHRLANEGAVSLTIIEVQTGSYLGEDDIERFEDAYGRISNHQ